MQLRETAPVSLSNTPQYFGFWAEKPLLKKEFVVPVHRRRGWRRPHSGSWSLAMSRGKGGGGGDGDGGGVRDNERGLLSTLDERDSLDGEGLSSC